MLKSILVDTDYTVADVYDDAAVIGKELEKLIANYGTDIIKDLMPKVIRVLELLEGLIIKNEKENDELIELKTKVNILENEKANRANERDKFEKELEDIEDKWKQETLKLIDMITKLKDDNKRLQDNIVNTKSHYLSQQQIIKQDELDYMKQIKEENLKLKEAIKYKDRELEQRNNDIDALQSQIDSLSGTILNFRRKQILAQTQTQKLVTEKTELECALKEKEHQINLLKVKIRTNSTNNDENNEETDNSTTENNKSQLLNRQDSTESNPMNSLDNNDPNRPRYTLNELHEVLIEKNELKVKLLETQEELQLFKKQEENGNSQNSNQSGEVQGPINREPDDKLDPRNKISGIRRFFRLFFLSNDSTNTNSTTQQQQQHNINS